MTHTLAPAIWLIVLIVGLPQLSETVYTPSLPDIARTLQVSESFVEYTLTTYLFGFAVGTLFWGKISDTLGRKICILSGLLLFTIGSIGCYFSHSIEALLFWRFFQAFGGSIGSVLGQAICRDAFHGPLLGKVYATIGSSLAVFPAIGPVIGGILSEKYDWSSIFLFLVACSIVLTILVALFLPETHHKENRSTVSFFDVCGRLIRDKEVIGFGLIVAGCNGILFSYFAEGSFYLINLLEMSPTTYGMTFIAMSASIMLGGLYSKRLIQRYEQRVVMAYGLMSIFFSMAIFTGCILVHTTLYTLSCSVVTIVCLLSQMGCMFGICIATSNALALSLARYKSCIGTASSIFGFCYYTVISLFTLGMGSLHDGRLITMPLYFLGISLCMLIVERVIIRSKVCLGVS